MYKAIVNCMKKKTLRNVARDRVCYLKTLILFTKIRRCLDAERTVKKKQDENQAFGKCEDAMSRKL